MANDAVADMRPECAVALQLICAVHWLPYALGACLQRSLVHCVHSKVLRMQWKTIFKIYSISIEGSDKSRVKFSLGFEPAGRREE